MIHDDTATLASGLVWLRKSWDTLPVPPVRIHVREIEDGSRLGAHRFSAPMWRIITGRATDEYDATESVMCGHPRLASCSAFDCPDCLGAGFYEHCVRRYRSPMAAALYRLSNVPKRGGIAPIDYILALYVMAWDVHRAAGLLELRPVSEDHAATIDAMFLLAIRQLHSRFSAGSVARIGWVEKSDAQRNAEDAA
jgi:hypothetical protein